MNLEQAIERNRRRELMRKKRHQLRLKSFRDICTNEVKFYSEWVCNGIKGRTQHDINKMIKHGLLEEVKEHIFSTQ